MNGWPERLGLVAVAAAAVYLTVLRDLGRVLLSGEADS